MSQHFTYNEALPHDGGTDAISTDGNRILISASAPATTGTPSTPPAVYSVALDSATSVATVSPYFNDTDPATVANSVPQEGPSVAWTGSVTPLPVAGAAFVPQGGLLFLPSPQNHTQDEDREG